MPSMIVIPDNDFVPLDDRPGVAFKAKRIVHARMRIHRNVHKQLKFSVKMVTVATGEDIPESDAQAYARKVADGLAPFIPLAGLARGPRPGPSPYDIAIERQSWVIVELDPWLDNWQFGKDYLGITTKVAKSGDNFGLQHVYPSKPDGTPGTIAHGNIKDEKCKVAYFGVARRAKGESQYFNLHTDFLQPARPGSRSMHRMIVIFDPDVGNNGGFPIPP
ncbi:MAG: nucleotide synthetase [Phenylobacterium sp.]